MDMYIDARTARYAMALEYWRHEGAEYTILGIGDTTIHVPYSGNNVIVMRMEPEGVDVRNVNLLEIVGAPNLGDMMDVLRSLLALEARRAAI